MTEQEKIDRVSSVVGDLNTFNIPISAAFSNAARFTGAWADDLEFIRVLEQMTKRMMLLSYRAALDYEHGDLNDLL